MSLVLVPPVLVLLKATGWNGDFGKHKPDLTESCHTVSKILFGRVQSHLWGKTFLVSDLTFEHFLIRIKPLLIYMWLLKYKVRCRAVTNLRRLSLYFQTGMSTGQGGGCILFQPPRVQTSKLPAVWLTFSNNSYKCYCYISSLICHTLSFIQI